jgi:hypothetical protein
MVGFSPGITRFLRLQNITDYFFSGSSQFNSVKRPGIAFVNMEIKPPAHDGDILYSFLETYLLPVMTFPVNFIKANVIIKGSIVNPLILNVNCRSMVIAELHLF